ncbi:dUTP diphosphatase [Bacillus sp. FJAT-45350]|uniref:dUTP diphosphatase n=1 Tax=Bacillus sp. FJAT-45350 TaxID=2011014 RepID=UPI000BB8C4C2|nr:dUTP diphosphatase [Bacillus sp. FJAT-45350]
MNLKKLFSLQLELDNRIIEEHRLEGRNVFKEKILALQVEVGELANETRCFKYWSHKSAAPHEKILEEYVDGVHFILSIGLSLNYTGTINDIQREHKSTNLVEQFQVVFSKISAFVHQSTIETFEDLFNEYLVLGEILGFTTNDIEEAYYKKNEINHQRQDEGY